MDNDQIKNILKGMGIATNDNHGDIEDAIIKALKGGGTEQAMGQLKLVAALFASEYNEFTNDPDFESSVRDLARGAYETVTSLDISDMREIEGMLSMMPDKETLTALITQAKDQSSATDALKNAETSENIAMNLNEETHIALAQAINSILPPKLKAFFDSVRPEGLSLEEALIQERHKVANSSVFERAERRHKMSKGMPVEVFANAAAEIKDNANAQSMMAGMDHFKAAVSPEDFEETALAASEVLKDVLNAVAAGKGLEAITTPATAKLSSQLKHIFAAAEQAITTAKIAPSAEPLSKALVAMKEAANDTASATKPNALKL